MSGNREYKSDVFSMLLEDKKNALQLYNALNGTAYDDPEQVEMRTLDKGVSLSVRNDAAFVLDSNLSIYEHQSTVCPNMPLRCIIYFSSIIEKIVKEHNIYGRAKIGIPTPKFAIFYNGSENQPEQYDMKLSDLYEKSTQNPQLELTCRVYNINNGRNKNIVDACPVLREYMIFVDYVREYHAKQKYENLELAINLAIDRCIQEDVLRDFLRENRAEVVKVTELDYTFDRQIELERRDARMEALAEGHAEGLAEGREKEIFSSVQEGDYAVERGAQKLNLSVKEFCNKMKQAGYEIKK